MTFAYIGPLGAGMSLWIPSRAGQSPLCFLDSIFQGHGMWHIFAPLGVGFAFLYILSEEEYEHDLSPLATSLVEVLLHDDFKEEEEEEHG